MNGRVALVTGAGAGIGEAVALRFAREGMTVGVLDIDGAACERVADTIAAAGGSGLALRADVADRADASAAVGRLREAHGPITVLVNNAAICVIEPFAEITDESWDRTFAINLRSLLAVTQAVLPDMLAAGWGRIINMSSSGAQTGAERTVAYAASKGGILSFTKSLAWELSPKGITVNSVAPSAIMDTLMSEQNHAVVPIPREVMASALPVRRTGVPDDIAGGCAWLASEESGFVTGQTIGINGGRFMP